MSSKKRKHRRKYDVDVNSQSDRPVQHELDPALYIQAYEADIVRGLQAQAAARSLGMAPDETGQLKHGDGLIQWGQADTVSASRRSARTFSTSIIDDDEVNFAVANDGIWVDRYDARLLLDSLPPLDEPATAAHAASPSGWSDLPSDSEDTFFLSPDEIESYRRDKRRRIIDRSREERLRALREAEGESAGMEAEEVWGGSDEEPDEAQRDFMRRTAGHLLSSPNPAQLEMRILANHGADKRFAFLRGRWSRAWKIVKGRERLAREEQAAKDEAEKAKAGLGGLAGYGDSDDDEGSEDDSQKEGAGEAASSEVDKPATVEDIRRATVDDAAKEARRARLKDWVEKRRTEKGV
ncbi:hypothetical protein HGRIS_010933 [Hohenbuehelia grisea]|uniref:Uncharacterized protein n=1 Tax=Hohenbuehelia grisea TaxID=104357 RepID=A0ABR3IYM6_9AGAR